MLGQQSDCFNFIIIGWNERTVSLIRTLTTIKNAKLTVIDHSLEELPYAPPNVELIMGNSMYDETLKKAGIEDSCIVFISADRHSSETISDCKSIISLLAIKSLNPTIYTVIEILSEANIHNAKRVGADKVVHTSEIVADLIINRVR